MNLEQWSRRVAPGGMFTEPSDSSAIFEGEAVGGPEGQVVLKDLRFDFQENAFRDDSGKIIRPRTPHPDYASRFPEAEKELENAIKRNTFRPYRSNGQTADESSRQT